MCGRTLKAARSVTRGRDRGNTGTSLFLALDVFYPQRSAGFFVFTSEVLIYYTFVTFRQPDPQIVSSSALK